MELLSNDIKKNIQQQAIGMLHSACTDYGILAGVNDQDNYKRIWARDGVLGGLAGLVLQDEVIIAGLGNTLTTLWNARDKELGTIPGNVDPFTGKKSFGSLAGRVDATTWFLIGAAHFIHHTGESDLLDELKAEISNIFKTLKAWEFNGRGLMYTPMSGNWADEYPYHGYLLYDNLLYYWACKLWGELLEDDLLKLKAYDLKASIQVNFMIRDEYQSKAYHPGLYQRLSKKQPPYFLSGFHPGGAYQNFDAAGNGLALLLGFYDAELLEHLTKFIHELWEDKNLEGLIPAFWPIIQPGDELWPSISSNFSYHFKNEPGHFHNGGIWPIWMGWMAMGLRKNGATILADKIKNKYENVLVENQYDFAEYLDAYHQQSGGQKPLTYSASGYVFSANNNFESLKTFSQK